jgi:hypothetical protein
VIGPGIITRDPGAVKRIDSLDFRAVNDDIGEEIIKLLPVIYVHPDPEILEFKFDQIHVAARAHAITFFGC